MVRIAYDPDGEFNIVDGYDEFIEQMEKRGMADVIDAESGIQYVAHEVGEQIYLLSRHAQNALEKLADSLIKEIADKSLH